MEVFIFIIFFLVYATGLIIVSKLAGEDFYIGGCKGASAYEFQIGKTVFRWCHLKGGFWKSWFQLARFSVKYYPEG